MEQIVKGKGNLRRPALVSRAEVIGVDDRETGQQCNPSWLVEGWKDDSLTVMGTQGGKASETYMMTITIGR